MPDALALWIRLAGRLSRWAKPLRRKPGADGGACDWNRLKAPVLGSISVEVSAQLWAGDDDLSRRSQRLLADLNGGRVRIRAVEFFGRRTLVGALFGARAHDQGMEEILL